ncbi:LysM peptidoglycan-binding domain-containing M23 family metallopeptidase [Flagellimonas flava]|uniref:LysM domain-containing protein n=1 Tax=Flagellimonas flava TaxID=570519 RepID=A0A1M5N8L7_9FLAO|nr:LysM peptidoglycan-binding domain-containing M23 family metallopeptidase [Allomuricauda flava]SHG85529.1 LysM domain-containing protein [Allomuricauda flava]
MFYQTSLDNKKITIWIAVVILLLVLQNVSANNQIIKLENGRVRLILNYPNIQVDSLEEDEMFISDNSDSLIYDFRPHKEPFFEEIKHFGAKINSLFIRIHSGHFNSGYSIMCLAKVSGSTIKIEEAFGYFEIKNTSGVVTKTIGRPPHNVLRDFIKTTNYKFIKAIDDTDFMYLNQLIKSKLLNNEIVSNREESHKSNNNLLMLILLKRTLTKGHVFRFEEDYLFPLAIPSKSFAHSRTKFPFSKYLQELNFIDSSSPKITVISKNYKDSILRKVSVKPENFKIKYRLIGYERLLRIKRIDGWIKNGLLTGVAEIFFENVVDGYYNIKNPSIRCSFINGDLDGGISFYLNGVLSSSLLIEEINLNNSDVGNVTSNTTLNNSTSKEIDETISIEKKKLDSLIPSNDNNDYQVVVVSGDNYYDISERMGFNLNQLIKSNTYPVLRLPINKDLKYQKLFNYKLHIVQKNETYSSIATRYGLTVAQLMEHNYWQEKYLPINEKVFIPRNKQSTVYFTTFYPNGREKAFIKSNNGNKIEFKYYVNDIFFPSDRYAYKAVVTGNNNGEGFEFTEEKLTPYFRDTTRQIYSTRIGNLNIRIEKIDTTIAEVSFNKFKGYNVFNGKSIRMSNKGRFETIYENGTPKSINWFFTNPTFNLKGDYANDSKDIFLRNVSWEQPDGFIAQGTMNYAYELVGPGKVYYPRCKEWTEFEEMSLRTNNVSCYRDWGQRVREELRRWRKDFFKAFNKPFDDLNESVCGNKPNCSISGGVGYTNGEGPHLLDGNGAPVERPKYDLSSEEFDPEFTYVLVDDTEMNDLSEIVELRVEGESTDYLYADIGNVNYRPTPLSIVPPVKSESGEFICEVREPDIYAKFSGGSFIGMRGGGRPHMGTDCITKVGQELWAPIDGKVEHVGYSYNSNKTFSLGAVEWQSEFVKEDNLKPRSQAELATVTIRNSKGVEVKLLYVARSPLIRGQLVRQGDLIGYSGDLSKVYPPLIPLADPGRMTQHTHFEVKIGKYHYNWDLTKKAKRK